MRTILKKMQKIPDVRPSITLDLYNLGMRSLEYLATKNLEELSKIFVHIRGKR
jgi:hypothetical protein